jgi:hypothetical protein
MCGGNREFLRPRMRGDGQALCPAVVGVFLSIKLLLLQSQKARVIGVWRKILCA